MYKIESKNYVDIDRKSTHFYYNIIYLPIYRADKISFSARDDAIVSLRSAKILLIVRAKAVSLLQRKRFR